MKKTVITSILLLLCCPLRSQNHQIVPDTAELVVKQYLDLLNFDAVKSDSTLYIESYIYQQNNPSDTIVMKRWFMKPYSERIEVWHKDTLMNGFISDHQFVYKMYVASRHQWEKVDNISYYGNSASGYDYHGPLYDWKSDKCELKYDGTWSFEGHDVHRVFVRSPKKYDRYYLFDKESGLLFLIDELDTHHPDMPVIEDTHEKWRAIHEYQPMGTVLFPSIESYLYEGEVTLIFHKFRYLKNDKNLYK